MTKLTDVSKLTRDQVVPYYRELILQYASAPFGQDEIWRVDNLILSKWRPSGLLYIKEKAWKEIIETTNNVALEIQKESKAQNGSAEADQQVGYHF